MSWKDNYPDLFKDGPTFVKERQITIPAYTTCNRCKFYEHHMFKSGMDPIYRDMCEHPEALCKGSMFHGNLSSDPIHHYVVTPEWCPFLKNKIDENKASEKDS